ncbi:MAG: DUF692 domain-containing protein, partial [Planctomycetales bacterium]
HVVCRNVEHARKVISAPLILENITYTVAFPGAELTEAEFLRELTDALDCGLLLDVTNIRVNCENHSLPAQEFLDALPLDRVTQLHFVGHSRRNGKLIDDHSSPTQPEIWSIMEEVARRAPVKGIILERDVDIPPFDELAAELARAREIGRRFGRWD